MRLGLKTCFIAICTLMFCAASAAADTPPAGYLIDNFDDNNYSSWVFYNASGISESGGYLQYTTSGLGVYQYRLNYSCSASTYTQIVIRMKVTNGDQYGLVKWYTGSGFNNGKSFTVTNDGQFHVYTINVEGESGWAGTITGFLLRPCYASGGSVQIDYMAVIEAPEVTKELLVGAFYYAGGWCSEGRMYYNGVPSGTDVRAYDWQLVHDRNQAYYDSNPFCTITAPDSFSHTFILQDWEKKYVYDAAGSMPTGFNYWVNVKRAGRFLRNHGHLFGWPSNTLFSEPLSTTDGYLGYYDCDQVSVFQTQIDTAANYGVDFFAFDQYWNYNNSTGKEETTHIKPTDSAFLAATNRNKMRFCINWTNSHAQDYSDTDMDKLADFLATHYFNKSNHLKIDGKPVLMIYNIDKDANGMLNVLGSQSAVNAKLTRLRNRIINTYGYSGVYVIALARADSSGKYNSCGFDAITEYNHTVWCSDKTYKDALTNVPSRWTTYQNNSNKPLMPVVNVCVSESAWWFGSRLYMGMNILNKHGMTGQETPTLSDQDTGACPANFKTLLQSAMNFKDNSAYDNGVVMVQAWNEWGEGNVIEPTQEYGYGYLEGIREKIGRNVIANWSFEDSGTSSWSLYNPSGGTAVFSKVSAPKTLKCTGLYNGRIAGANVPWCLAMQTITSDKFTAGRTYSAWAEIKTTSVAGNGARLRIDFRNSSGVNIACHQSAVKVTGTTSDFQRVAIHDTIPAGTASIWVQICGSTDVGSGAGSIIDFDDVVFKPTIAPGANPPSATISASPAFITGSGSTTISWSTTGCSTARVYYTTNDGSETYWRNGTSGSQSFYGTAGNTYVFNVYKDTAHTRLLKSATVVCRPGTPSGYTIDDYQDGSISNTWFNHISGQSESNGTLKCYTTGTDPIILKYGLSCNTNTYKQVKIRLKVIHGDTSGRLYWKTNSGSWDGNHSQAFTVINDGKWHEYTLNLTSHAYWTGTVNQFRLDPVTASGALLEVDYIVATP